MKNLLLRSIVLVSMMSITVISSATAIDSSMLLVTTEQGLVRGIIVDSVCVWKGIPYAKAPVGDLRFRAPQRPDSWAGVRDGSAFGPAAPQTRRIARQPNGRSEDCLSLNVWAPAADGQKRPVMVWIHGGGFLVGSNSTEMYDGASLSRNGDVVVVNINYRLGGLGFLYFGGIRGSNAGFDDNLGIRDQVAALQWVKNNIAAFGGDPDMVTVFGESAGAISVLTLMAVPSAHGLFKRAIVESASPESLWQPKTATDLTLRYLKMLGVTPDNLAKLKTIPTDTFTEKMDALFNELMHETTTVKILAPTIDGIFVTEDPLSAIREGKAAGIDLMIGTTKDESTLLALKRIGITPRNAEELAPYLANIAPEKRKNLIAQYRHFPRRRGVMAMTTDGIFIMPSIKVSELQTKFASTYMYRFDWSSPAMKLFGLRACHGAELPFVFGTLDRSPGKYFALLSNKKLNWKLSHQIQLSWSNFARYGNPDPKGETAWGKYDASQRSTMIFDKKKIQAMSDPRSEQRVAWIGLSIFK